MSSTFKEVVAQRSWTNEQLEEAVEKASSLHGVFAELGLAVGGTQWVVIRQLIRELGLSTAHWDRPLSGRGATGTPRWTDDDLRRLVPDCRSLAELLHRLGFEAGGRTQTRIKARIEALELDTTHMTGQAWLRGKENPRPRRYRRPLEEILVEDSDYRNNRVLKDRLIRAGSKRDECERCGIREWNDAPLVMHLDHINGDRRDNRLDNLRLLCPNCHSQADTFCGRNMGRYASEDGAAYDVA